MRTSSRNELRRGLIPALLMVFLSVATGCSEPAEVAIPLLVISGPNNFTSFEMQASNGETIWRLEADVPSEIPHIVYAVVPNGFRQVFPTQGPPRPFQIGEDLEMRSRIPNREFVHRAFATTPSTVSILTSEMRRLDVESPETPLRD